MSSSQPGGHVATEVSDTGPASHRSLAFELLLRQLEKRPSSTVLDLGPALGENVAFLSALPARIWIADLPPVLVAGPRGDFAPMLDRELPELAAGSVDAILAWDRLNYLDAKQIKALGRRLLPCCAPGALLFALVNTAAEMPDRPQLFRIAGRDRLIYEPTSRARRSSPRYNEPDLRRWLTSFDVDVSYLLRNRMQEYLFGVARPLPESRTG